MAQKAEQARAGSQPELVVLYCRQSLAAEVKPFQGRRPGEGFNARLVLLPCSSKMEPRHLLKILEGGADGVLVVACPQDACRFLVGNSRAERRADYTRVLLDQVGMGAERLALVRGRGLDVDGVMKLAAGQADKLKQLGPNPLGETEA